MRELFFGLLALLRRKKVEQELDSELTFHLEQQSAKYMHAGMSREEALRRAGLEFGGLNRVKEQCREARGMAWIGSVAQDLKYGVRTLGRSPGFSAITVMILGLGIGAATSVYTLLDAVMLRPLPYKNASRLVMVVQRMPNEEAPVFDAYREFEDWNRSNTSFEKLAAATWAQNSGAVLTWKGQKQQVSANRGIAAARFGRLPRMLHPGAAGHAHEPACCTPLRIEALGHPKDSDLGSRHRPGELHARIATYHRIALFCTRGQFEIVYFSLGRHL